MSQCFAEQPYDNTSTFPWPPTDPTPYYVPNLSCVLLAQWKKCVTGHEEPTFHTGSMGSVLPVYGELIIIVAFIQTRDNDYP